MYILDSFLSLICPPLCLHCEEPLTPHHKLLCESCLHNLQLISPLSRCPFCFSEVESKSAKPCSECYTKERFCNYIASCFDFDGPARTLIKELKYCDEPHLAKSLASFLFMQFTELKWPTPDLITYVPTSFRRYIERGYNQSELLAKALADLLQLPVVSLLKKTESTISQTYLNKALRKDMMPDIFALKQTESIEDKILLLIDDVSTTGTTLQAATQALQEGYPKSIYGLTVCHTDR